MSRRASDTQELLWSVWWEISRCRGSGWVGCRCPPPSLPLTPPCTLHPPLRRPTPGGGPGTLTVVDNRTGKRYEMSIDDHGTIKATDLKQVTAGGDGVGLRTYDNG